MRTIHYKIALCLLFIGTSLFAQQKAKTPIQKNTTTIVDSEFLLKAFNGRMIATDQAKLAARKGTTPQLRQFAALMIKDQNQMYKAIKPMGAARNMVFPKSIDYIEGNGREKLVKLSGPDFDRRYKIQAAQGLQNDITLFKKASNSKNKEISDLAKEFLPLLESHLVAIQALD